MLKMLRPDTAIRIQYKKVSDDGFATETWSDLIDEDILCEWKNKHGGEVYKAAAENAKEPATIKLWYIPGVNPTCRVIRLNDGYELVDGVKVYNAVFEIINVDDVMNRHQQLEIELKRYVSG